jgi:hypothetical protein
VVCGALLLCGLENFTAGIVWPGDLNFYQEKWELVCAMLGWADRSQVEKVPSSFAGGSPSCAPKCRLMEGSNRAPPRRLTEC